MNTTIAMASRGSSKVVDTIDLTSNERSIFIVDLSDDEEISNKQVKSSSPTTKSKESESFNSIVEVDEMNTSNGSELSRQKVLATKDLSASEIGTGTSSNDDEIITLDGPNEKDGKSLMETQPEEQIENIQSSTRDEASSTKDTGEIQIEKVCCIEEEVVILDSRINDSAIKKGIENDDIVFLEEKNQSKISEEKSVAEKISSENKQSKDGCNKVNQQEISGARKDFGEQDIIELEKEEGTEEIDPKGVQNDEDVMVIEAPQPQPSETSNNENTKEQLIKNCWDKMRKLKRQIKEVGEQEVDLNDKKSSYVEFKVLQEEYMTCYKVYCRLIGEDVNNSRNLTKLKETAKFSNIPSLDAAIKNYFATTTEITPHKIEMPQFDNLLEITSCCYKNNDESEWDNKDEEAIAYSTFSKITQHVQKIREEGYKETFSYLLEGNGEIIEDEQLKKSLKKNDEIGAKRMNRALEKFVELQERLETLERPVKKMKTTDDQGSKTSQ